MEVFDTMQEEVHTRTGRGHQVTLLAVELEGTLLFALSSQLRDSGKQHAARAAGGVIDRFPGLRVQHQRHQVNDGTVGIKLGGGVPTIVGKLFDEIFVCLSQFVFRHVSDREDERGEVFHQVAQCGIREAFFVGPLRIAKDAVKLFGVSLLDLAHGCLHREADVFTTLRTSRQ